jgi:hypothetical protein
MSKVAIERDWFSAVREDERQVLVVERGIAPMDGNMVVRADQRHVRQGICPAPAEPLDVVALAEILPVLVPRVPEADLASAGV